MSRKTLDHQNVGGEFLAGLLKFSCCFLCLHSVDLVHDNLKKVCDLLYDARSRWFDLGFQLDIKYTMLEVIKKDHSDVNSCFREMLSTWLKMIDPPPSWECLMTALEHDSVKCGDLAESIRQRFGIRNIPEIKTAMKRPSPAPAGKPSNSRKFRGLSQIIVLEEICVC